MKKVLVLLILVGIGLGGCTATDKCHSEQGEESLSEIEKLIQALGSDDWPTREKAQAELIEIGEKLIQEYRKAKRTQINTDSQDNKLEPISDHLRPIKEFADALRVASQSNDPEIRNRAKRIRQYFYTFTQPKIAFHSWNSMKTDIYVIDVNGKNLTKLTNNYSKNKRTPIWSPDGTKILFHSYPLQLMWDLHMMDNDGQNQKRLTSSDAYETDGTWSPDGTKIAFGLRHKGDNQLYVLDVAIGNQQRLTENHKIGDDNPAWSPDGTKIAFASKKKGNKDIYITNTKGETQKRLTDTPRDDRCPTWSPDGTKIAFVSARDGNREIYVMDADGKNQKRLTLNRAVNHSPTWNPDGTKIAFVSFQDGNWEIYVINADGEGQKRLTNSHASDIKPCFSPDGTQIAFVSKRGGGYAIYIMDADGNNQKRLTNTGNEGDMDFDWKPVSLLEISEMFKVEEK